MNSNEKPEQINLVTEPLVAEPESYGEMKNGRWDTPKELIESAVREIEKGCRSV